MYSARVLLSLVGILGGQLDLRSGPRRRYGKVLIDIGLDGIANKTPTLVTTSNSTTTTITTTTTTTKATMTRQNRTPEKSSRAGMVRSPFRPSAGGRV